MGVLLLALTSSACSAPSETGDFGAGSRTASATAAHPAEPATGDSSDAPAPEPVRTPLGQARTAQVDTKHADAARALGLPPNGPDVLYAPLADVPQIQNRDPRFRAPFEPVSGTERYVDGEYQYTDFVYDDDATTYPADFGRYGGNSGDLAELRISARSRGQLAVRFTLNTLLVPDSTIIALVFDSDDDVTTGTNTLPRDPGMPFPGTDQVLTTWGTGAEWSRWTGFGWSTSALEVSADLESNQITVTVPKSVADPSGTWRATLATGSYDSSGGWLGPPTTTDVAGIAVPATVGSTSKIINLGFRLNEVPAMEPGKSSPHPAPWTRQNEALAAGEPARFAHRIDFDLLRSRGTRDNVPESGMMYRIFASRQKTVMVSTDGTPANGNPRQLGEGKDSTSLHGRYLSPLQPYALYVPSGYKPGQPAPLTLSMHGDGGEYFWLNGNSNFAITLLGEERNSIVLSPSGRGRSGFYVGNHEYDVFEAWNDVAHRFTLDPTKTVATGYSMGGHGSYRLGLLHPHLFLAAVPMVPAICRGMWLIAKCTTTEDTVANHWVENARNLPIFHIADGLSELTFYPGQLQQVMGPEVNGLRSLDSLGYRYKFWSVATEHFTVGTNHPEITTYLEELESTPGVEPFHVTFVRMPSSDLVTDDPLTTLVHDRAYWLSEITVRDGTDPLAKGVVDAVSFGFGKTDPTSSLSDPRPGTTTAGFPYVETQRVWGDPGNVAAENRISIKVANIASLTIDPVAAKVDCDVQLQIDSDGPAPTVTLLGCPR